MRKNRPALSGNDSNGGTATATPADGGTPSKKRGRSKKAPDDNGAPAAKKQKKAIKAEVVELEDDDEVEEGEIQSDAGMKEGEELGVDNVVKKEAETTEGNAVSPKLQTETEASAGNKAGIGMDNAATDMGNDEGTRHEVDKPSEAAAVIKLDGDDAW